MNIWQVTLKDNQATYLVPGKTIQEALAFYMNCMEGEGDKESILDDILSINLLGELMVPTGKILSCGDFKISDKQKRARKPKGYLGPKAPAPTPTTKSIKELILDAVRLRGKPVGFSRDLIPFISKDVLERYWPHASMEGVAKAIGQILEKAQVPCKGSPKLWQFGQFV